MNGDLFEYTHQFIINLRDNSQVVANALYHKWQRTHSEKKCQIITKQSFPVSKTASTLLPSRSCTNAT